MFLIYFDLVKLRLRSYFQQASHRCIIYCFRAEFARLSHRVQEKGAQSTTGVSRGDIIKIKGGDIFGKGIILDKFNNETNFNSTQTVPLIFVPAGHCFVLNYGI